MTIFHTSPLNGNAERCRAKAVCPYGATYGTSLRKDGTTKVGTGGASWTVMKNPPKSGEERIIIGTDGNISEVRYSLNGETTELKGRNSNQKKSATQKIETPAETVEKPIEKPTDTQPANTADIVKKLGEPMKHFTERFTISDIENMNRKTMKENTEELVSELNAKAEKEIEKQNQKALKEGKPLQHIEKAPYTPELLVRAWEYINRKDEIGRNMRNEYIERYYYTPGGDSKTPKETYVPGQSQKPIQPTTPQRPTREQQAEAKTEKQIEQLFGKDRLYNITNEEVAKRATMKLTTDYIRATAGNNENMKQQLAAQQKTIQERFMNMWKKNHA